MIAELVLGSIDKYLRNSDFIKKTSLNLYIGKQDILKLMVALADRFTVFRSDEMK